MRVLRWPVLLLTAAAVSTVQAGPLFPWRKVEKPDPKVRVPALIATLKDDRDEYKRSSAASELRNYDVAQFPEIIPSLVAALLTDARPGVRIDAAQSLGRIRPVSQAAGEALEQALEKDSSMRVRLQARSLLLQYHWAGYRSAKKTDVPPLTTAPPATERRPGISGLFLPAIRTTPAVKPTPTPGATTGEPPLATPDSPPPVKTTPGTVTPGTVTPASGPRPLPQAPPVKEDGPILP